MVAKSEIYPATICLKVEKRKTNLPAHLKRVGVMVSAHFCQMGWPVPACFCRVEVGLSYNGPSHNGPSWPVLPLLDKSPTNLEKETFFPKIR